MDSITIGAAEISMPMASYGPGTVDVGVQVVPGDLTTESQVRKYGRVLFKFFLKAFCSWLVKRCLDYIFI